MSIPEISLEQSRLVHLAAQGLLHQPPPKPQKQDILDSVKRMGVLQIDTINVVARSSYLVLFSRLGDYKTSWLGELLQEGYIFEQWAHAACFIPIEDFPLARRFVLDGDRVSYFGDWINENREAVDGVLAAIRSNGPMRSADFKSPKESGGWWNWKVEKGALEYWMSHGELMVARRENFQRVYDLTDRVLPGWEDSRVPTRDEVTRELIRRSTKSLGVTRPEWIADYYRLPKRDVAIRLPEMVAQGELLEVRVQDWDECALYMAENEPLVDAAARGELYADHTTLLSPFDPVTWDRSRTRQWFNFDFLIQAYTPAEKRQYGYFPLPILHNGNLVGRLDAKAHRKEEFFEIRGFYLEKDINPEESLLQDIAEAIQQCAGWHETPQVRIKDSNSSESTRLLSEFFPLVL